MEKDKRIEKEIVFEDYNESHREKLFDIIRKTWNYDQFASPKIAKKLSVIFLYSCLAQQTFTKVALIDNTPVGVIMARNKSKEKFNIKYKFKQFMSIISLMISKEGRQTSKIFKGVSDTDKVILNEANRNYSGELVFFAIDSDCRGMGLGKKLFSKAKEYMKSDGMNDFYLFTDTTCNFGFYEHNGMTRRGEKREQVEVDGQKADMKFFIYDFDL